MSRKTKVNSIVLDAIMGFVVGDALGVPVEFRDRKQLKKEPVIDMREYGTHNQPKGTWSDDSSMTLATMDSLLCGYDYDDMMIKFTKWAIHAEYTAHNHVFDMGISTRKAIAAYCKGVEPVKCGGTTEKDNGNGSLMRIIPIILYLLEKEKLFHNNFAKAVELVQEASCLTHAHTRSQMACAIYAKIFVDLAVNKNRKSITDIIIQSCNDIIEYYIKNGTEEEKAGLIYFSRIQNIHELITAEENSIYSTGYVMHTLEAAIWCFVTTQSYKECVLKAVNLGDDTDTVAAIAGGLAGVYYGYNQIPEGWLKVIKKREWIENLCYKFTKIIS